MSDEEQKILKAPWYAKMTSQMGPVIVVMFILLWVVVMPLRNVPQDLKDMKTDHATLVDQMKLSNHFLWADCVNQANLIQDMNMRKDALSRCIPPLDKQIHADDQAYLYLQQDPYRNPYVLASNRGISSSSSSFEFVTTRKAEERAAEQNRVHLQAISGALEMSDLLSRLDHE